LEDKLEEMKKKKMGFYAEKVWNTFYI
jgi:hypothetical protein